MTGRILKEEYQRKNNVVREEDYQKKNTITEEEYYITEKE